MAVSSAAVLCLGGCAASDNANSGNSNVAIVTNTRAGNLNSNAANTNSAVTPEDHAFVIKASMGGEGEVQLGQLAVKNAKSPDVKQFGQRMVDDHTKVGKELQSLAGKKNLTAPTEVDSKTKGTLDRLSKLSGDAFDKAYMTEMVDEHEADVAAFQRQSTSPGDKDLSSFAAKSLPTLEEHLQMAKSIAAKLK